MLVIFQLLQTRTVSVFPVGHTYLTGVASPIVQAGVVVDFMNPFPGQQHTECIPSITSIVRDRMSF